MAEPTGAPSEQGLPVGSPTQGDADALALAGGRHMMRREGRARVSDGYVIRFRDRSGGDRVSLSCPTLDAAIRHGRVLELHGADVLAVIGPEGEFVRWDQLEMLVELAASMKPPIA